MQTSGSLIAVEWSCSPSFSPLVGEAVVDKLKSLHYTIRGLTSVSWGLGCGGSRAGIALGLGCTLCAGRVDTMAARWAGGRWQSGGLGWGWEKWRCGGA